MTQQRSNNFVSRVSLLKLLLEAVKFIHILKIIQLMKA